jgi:hypothetical protein
MAAGWSLGSYNYAWTSEVSFNNSGSDFRAVVVDFDNGLTNWYYVADGYPVAVCLP